MHTNIMVVCSFHMSFTWTWLGQEGFAHDWMIIEATMTLNINFPHDEGKVCNYILI